MTLSEKYRIRALDCRLRAESVQDHKHRTLFLHMEECWLVLAARADTADECETGEQE